MVCVYEKHYHSCKCQCDRSANALTANMDQPGRELFIWAVLFSRMRIAMIFWKTCPDQIGAALVANLMFKSMAHKAELTEELQMAEELRENARFALFTVFADFRRLSPKIRGCTYSPLNHFS